VLADYWTLNKESKENKEIKCLLCPNFCVIGENSAGKCSVRANIKGELVAESYGYVSSIALDPIEKKPLYNFQRGSKILSIGSYGCNLHCPFCQNYAISLEYDKSKMQNAAPELIARLAMTFVPDGNIGVAYTYNEPLIGFEFVRDTGRLIKEAGLMNVIVTNGYINIRPLSELLPIVDAMNIDIKGNQAGTYNMVGGKAKEVKSVIEAAHKVCHVEVTTLITPEQTKEDIEDIAKWLSGIDPNIPYHLTRFFPRYKYIGKTPTPAGVMYEMKNTAGQYLENVFLGNM